MGACVVPKDLEDETRSDLLQDTATRSAADLHVCQHAMHSVQASLLRDYLD